VRVVRHVRVPGLHHPGRDPMPGVCRETESGMNGLLVTASVAPLLATPSLRSEQVSQLVMGEGAEVLDSHYDMLHVRTLLDNYEGWLAEGYVVPLPLAEVETWLGTAAWSQGALLSTRGGMAIRAPHRARLMLEGDGRVQLPTGESAEVLSGSVTSHAVAIERARRETPAEWAWREFAGTPYLWGGVTGAGIDCSGLTQNTFLARGVTLPRDAERQAAHGTVVELGNRAPGDLLFFRARDSERIGHVAILADEGMLVHSTVDTGGVVRETLAPGSRPHSLLARLVAVRRVD
jgi:cell wall-associated NlpC family hydrolase